MFQILVPLAVLELRVSATLTSVATNPCFLKCNSLPSFPSLDQKARIALPVASWAFLSLKSDIALVARAGWRTRGDPSLFAGFVQGLTRARAAEGSPPYERMQRNVPLASTASLGLCRLPLQTPGCTSQEGLISTGLAVVLFCSSFPDFYVH